MSAVEDRLYRFAYEWHEAMNSPYTVNMMPLLLEAASDVRSLAAPSLEVENAKLRELVEDMHAALQAFCDAQDVHGDNCPLWVERTDDCELRGIERRMRELEVDA